MERGRYRETESEFGQSSEKLPKLVLVPMRILPVKVASQVPPVVADKSVKLAMRRFTDGLPVKHVLHD